ncbi:MAG TPA: glycosyltransferase family 2 protein [Chloroflexota bacterium]|nr:glycosyltransferase family 2 protein [Chloroflexota bacterium]
MTPATQDSQQCQESLPGVTPGATPRSRVSLVIPTFNGMHLLGPCLDAVASQTRRPDETIVVDDASTDGTAAMLGTRYPWVRLVRRQRNGGFAAATNTGIRASSGEIVVLLNNDTEAEPGWLAALVAPLEQDRSIGFCASKLLLFDRRDVLHSAADGYSVGGEPVNRGAWTADDGRFEQPELVFGACAGAAAYRRTLLNELGGLDEWLVAYLEDVDLSWRAQLRGYRCLFVPAARVYHHVSASGGGVRPSYYCGRNFLLVLASDVPGDLLRRHWPTILRRQGAIILSALRHIREPAARARLAGYLDGLRLLPAALRRRRTVQASRAVPLEYLESLLTPI